MDLRLTEYLMSLCDDRSPIIPSSLYNWNIPIDKENTNRKVGKIEEEGNECPLQQLIKLIDNGWRLID